MDQPLKTENMTQLLTFLDHNYVAFFIATALLLKFFTWDFATIKTETGRKLLPYYSIVMLATFYPLGKICQFTHIGPIWVRSWLGDMGFVAFIATWYLVRHISSKTSLYSLKRSGYQGVIFGALIAVGFELFQLWLDNSYNLKSKNFGFTARGDWMDVFTFCYTAVACIFLVRGIQVPSSPPVEETGKKKNKRKKQKAPASP